MTSGAGVRPHGFVDLGKAANAAGGVKRASGRAQNFEVEWIEAGAAGAETSLSSAEEIMLLLPDTGVRVIHGGKEVGAPADSVAILPAGGSRIVFGARGLAVAITATPSGRAANEAAYATRDARIVPARPAMKRSPASDEIVIHEMAAVRPPKDGPRYKMLQSSAISINWVAYDGPRDRSQLSPHNHADFEQGSLAIRGDFVQHMRVPWAADAAQWRDDVHLPAGPGTLSIFPVGLIHTSEGVGAGRHLLIDVFAPPRGDFIAKGWVHNSGDYER